MDLDKELTKKFLSGEMSFAEYSSEWYMNEDEEDQEEVEELRRNDDEPSLSASSLEKSIQKRSRRCTRLSPALMGLMGEANLRFARGEVEMAERMCHEIIKQVPTASEPFQTLAQIYENDKDKHLQFGLLAAHLSPSDPNEWLRLAAMCKERQDVKQEMICYNRAIRAQPQNLEIHLKRLEAFTSHETSDKKISFATMGISEVKCYFKIVQCLHPSESDEIIKYAKLAATIFHNNNDIENALQVMSIAYKKCPHKFTREDLNIYLELLITQKQFQTCIDIFVANIGVEIEAEILTVKENDIIEEVTHYTKCVIPNDLPIDFKSKLLICFINLKSMDLVKTLLNDFLSNDVEKAGDLYMDIEEALSSLGHYELALQMLEPLVKSNNFDLGAVWLKHANCLFYLEKFEEAAKSYYKVLEHAPQHPDAKRQLFKILQKMGKIDEALQILKQNHKYVVSPTLLFEQCCLLKKYNRLNEYLEAGEALLSRTFARYRHVEELSCAFKLRGGLDVIQQFRTAHRENPFNDDDIQFDEDEDFKLSPQDEWNLFTDLLKTACELKQYVAMQRMAFGSVVSKNLAPYRTQIDFYCLQASLLNKDYQKAFRFIKDFTTKLSTNRCWNLLNFVVYSFEENSQVKTLCRLFQKENKIVKNLFLGNNFLITGRYLVALKYFIDYHEQSEEPLSALLIAITILIMASQRTVDKHHNLVLQGMAYLLSYKKLRQCDQEAYYNIGRAYQMMKINNLAIEHYERALEAPVATHCDKHGCINLTKEIAFNLYILYKDQSPQIARQYMMKYLVIE